MGRFKEPALMVLVSLAEADKHGYAIMEDIEAITGQKIGAGTLYGAITRLEKRGHIVPVEGDDPRRQVYRISPDGRAMLDERLAQMQHIVAVAQQRLGASG